MVKLVKENLNSFVRNQDPIKSLKLGYEGKIRNFFRQYEVPDEDYEVKEDNLIVFNKRLNLRNTNITELPDNLTINGWLDLSGTKIFKLPNNLTVTCGFNRIKGNLYLNRTNITELPYDLIVNNEISVYSQQEELIKWIEHSKFKDKLIVIHNC